MTTCTTAQEQPTDVMVAENDQTQSGIVDPTVFSLADQEANRSTGCASAPRPAEFQQRTTPRYTLSITLGRVKPSIADYKSSMLNDTSFIPKTIALSQLKDFVK